MKTREKSTVTAALLQDFSIKLFTELWSKQLSNFKNSAWKLWLSTAD